MKKNLITFVIISLCLTILFLIFVSIPIWHKPETAEVPLMKIPLKPTEIKKEAVLSFSDSYLEVKRGERFNLDVLLDAKRDVFGVDVFLEYNSDLIKLDDITANLEIGNLVKPKKEYQENQIAFSVLAPVEETFTGKVRIATLKFLARELGAAEIKFILDNSHVAVENGKDILGEIKNAQIKIIAD
ncbi:hypothetical protein COT20_02340 [bacterium (Candidatus Gribaldobacteria) CG08_land_8_20_14_0_20_39_15]|uniref:Cohesin domain-containing protein n=1 Tax=bacterium (Candidatus Gribaldobacteria) CG08_land_8_20_14_0_20_39_15 TaxID=2014273 RepID=A0A2M6XUB3_9BACT|nr:MAG: hypothetical protein COT20_02340 [bacterium (Candidatus Gribaldobacteria) CG08_land_8_20_14_0_20_39_15]